MICDYNSLVSDFSALMYYIHRTFQPVKMIAWNSILLVLLSLAFIPSPTQAAIDEIKIGVLIKDRGLEEPLNNTLEMLNADTSVLAGTRLVAIVEIIESDNSFKASSAGK